MAPTASRETRRLTIIAQDPAVQHDERILRATVDIPYEVLADGPRGYRVKVVDYDSSSDTLYRPLRLADGDPYEKASDATLLADPGFHQQNAYAIVMQTLARFEFALGRRVPWGFRSHQLSVVPHAFADANAFYAEDEEALAFGYFQGRKGRVFTCLSHDIVAHETTHALLDGVHTRLTDPSSPDQAAFHEGFADIVAILSVFALRDIVAALLAKKCKGRSDPRLIWKTLVQRDALAETSLLGLAEEMGQEMPELRGDVLRRSVKIKASRLLLKQPAFQEPHDRGEVLVAAILNTFLDAWAFRIGKLGKISPGAVDLSRVVEDGSELADTMLTMMIRALDYLPPVDLEFGDFLSAVLTADSQMRADDSKYELRKHLRDTCSRYGIDTPPATGEQGYWQPAPEKVDDSRVRLESLQRSPEEVFRFIWDNRSADALGLDEEAYTNVPYVRPVVRVAPDGFVLRETVSEYTQMLELYASELRPRKIAVPKGMKPDQRVRIYGGGTLIFDERGTLKFHIYNSIGNAQKQSDRLAYLWEEGYYRDAAARRRGFAELHRARAINMPAIEEEW
jgi:hypothetical protein